MDSMKALVVLPSYNERDNIVSLVETILRLQPDARICVVDDSSPDGTAGLLRAAIDATAEWRARVQLIVRPHKDGRGGAVRAGLAWGLAQRQAFEAFVEMDCDFSHEPEAIAQGLARIAHGDDVVIGARYPNGTIIGWPATRRAFSFFANALARALIDWQVSDYTNGFRFYSPRAVQLLLQVEQHHKGYIYLSESLSQLLRGGMRVSTFPIRFRNRERGQSNTTLAEVRAALVGVFQIGWQHRFGRS
jgi:dolichol-phosphate mannosyltransferase